MAILFPTSMDSIGLLSDKTSLDPITTSTTYTVDQTVTGKRFTVAPIVDGCTVTFSDCWLYRGVRRTNAGIAIIEDCLMGYDGTVIGSDPIGGTWNKSDYYYQATIGGGGTGTFEIRRTVIRFTTEGPRLVSDCIVEDSWISDMYAESGDHSDALQSLAGTNMIVRRNWIDCVAVEDSPVSANSAIIVQELSGDIELYIGQNYINCDGFYTLNLGGGNITLVENRIGPDVGSVFYPGSQNNIVERYENRYYETNGLIEGDKVNPANLGELGDSVIELIDFVETTDVTLITDYSTVINMPTAVTNGLQDGDYLLMFQTDNNVANGVTPQTNFPDSSSYSDTDWVMLEEEWRTTTAYVGARLMHITDASAVPSTITISHPSEYRPTRAYWIGILRYLNPDTFTTGTVTTYNAPRLAGLTTTPSDDSLVIGAFSSQAGASNTAGTATFADDWVILSEFRLPSNLTGITVAYKYVATMDSVAISTSSTGAFSNLAGVTLGLEYLAPPAIDSGGGYTPPPPSRKLASPYTRERKGNPFKGFSV